MRDMVGCSVKIAVVAFMFGLIGSLFATEAGPGERLMLAMMPAGMAFVAAMILFSRDYLRQTRTIRLVRQALLIRVDVSDAEFVAHFPTVDTTLLVQTRQAVARFFGVPPAKVHPTDQLRQDLQFETLEPGFHSFVVHDVLYARQLPLHPFTFRTGHLKSIGDLAAEIHAVFNACYCSGPGDHFVRPSAAEVFQQAGAEDALAHSLGRIGYFFTASCEQAGCLDLAKGPKAQTEPSGPGPSVPLVADAEFPDLHEPAFLNRIVSCVMAVEPQCALEVVRQTESATLYRVPCAATDILAQWMPERSEETMMAINEITDRLMLIPEIAATYKRGGVLGAVLTLRGHALATLPRGSGREVYYWFWSEQSKAS